MNKLTNIFYFIVLALVVSACATTQKTSTASKTYSEDLSEFRPKVGTEDEELSADNEIKFRKTKENINPKNDVSDLLNAKLDTLAQNNEEIKYVNGYAIQVYSGSSSSEAYEARDSAMHILPEIKTVVKYEQPIYKVRVGSFTERLEVQRTLLKLKHGFPAAISVPARIKVN